MLISGATILLLNSWHRDLRCPSTNSPTSFLFPWHALAKPMLILILHQKKCSTDAFADAVLTVEYPQRAWPQMALHLRASLLYLSSLPRRALLSASLPWSITPCAASSAVPLDAPTHKGPATVLRQSDNTAAELRRSPCYRCSGSDIKLLLIETLQCRNDWHEFRLWTV